MLNVNKILLVVGPLAGVAALSSAILVGSARGDSAAEATGQPGNSLATSSARSHLAVPDSSAQQKALQEVKSVLKGEYSRAVDTKGQAALGRMLARLVAEGGDGSAVRYVMASQALELAVKSGEVNLAVDSQEELILWYDIDAWDLRSKTLTQLTQNVRTVAARDRLARRTFELVELALAEDRYPLAVELAGRGAKLAAESGDSALRDQGRGAIQRAQRMQQEAAEVDAAIDRLMQQPNDPEGNLTIGKFRCFEKEDWRTGLSFLANGSDDILKELAREELQEPTSSADQVRLADNWWELAQAGERDSDSTAKPMQMRAIYWYRRALPNLTGFTLVKAQQRVGEEVGSVKKGRPGMKTQLKPELR